MQRLAAQANAGPPESDCSDQAPEAAQGGDASIIPALLPPAESAPEPDNEGKEEETPTGVDVLAETGGGEEGEGTAELLSEIGPKQRGRGICKRYSAMFLWGQLNFWFKQTVSDPAASLSAERRYEDCHLWGMLQTPKSFACPCSPYLCPVALHPAHAIRGGI